MRSVVWALAALIGCSSTGVSRFREVVADAGPGGSSGGLGTGGSFPGGSGGGGATAGSVGAGGSGSTATGGAAGSAIAGTGGSSGSAGSLGSAGSFGGATGGGAGGSGGTVGSSGSVGTGGSAGTGGVGGTGSSCLGMLNCDSAPDCETRNGTWRACGSCQNQCGYNEFCDTGTTCAVCPIGWRDCDGDPANYCETNVPEGKSCWDIFHNCGTRCHTWQTCTAGGTCI